MSPALRALATMQMLRDALGDDKYGPAPLLKEMGDAGLLGRSGAGFHDCASV